MSDETMTLTDFLLARIAEDEAIGRDWRHNPGKVQVHGGGTGYLAICDPARVLAECEAKRRIVGMCSPSGEDEDGDPFYVGGYGEAYVETLAYLALPYADHPDYREEWRP